MLCRCRLPCLAELVIRGETLLTVINQDQEQTRDNSSHLELLQTPTPDIKESNAVRTVLPQEIFLRYRRESSYLVRQSVDHRIEDVISYFMMDEDIVSDLIGKSFHCNEDRGMDDRLKFSLLNVFYSNGLLRQSGRFHQLNSNERGDPI